jgi:CBS domain containing-hemolysin-like protein
MAVFTGLVVVLFVLAIIEASLLHLRRSAVAASGDEGDAQARRLLDLLDRLPRVLNAVLLAVLFTQVTATTVAGLVAHRISDDIGVTVTTVLVTIVLFVYGEAIPKTIAIRNPLRYARRLVVPIHWLDVVLGPFVRALLWFAERQSPRTDGHPNDVVSERELRHIAGQAAAAGQIEPSDADLIERSLELGDLRAERLVVPIERVVSVAGNTPVSDALDVALAAGHRRLAVHGPSPEELTGFVRLRDLAATAASNPRAPVSDVERQAPHIGHRAPVIDVLRTMQSTRRHLGIVENDDGCTIGILTVEDIVEELVGSIHEPHPDGHDAAERDGDSPGTKEDT